SLMALLSVCGVRMERFLFYGFLSPKSEMRAQEWKQLRSQKQPFVVMETPYRCARFLQDLATKFPEARCVIGLNLTAANERVIRARGKEISAHGPFEDAEPIVLVVP